MERYPIPKNEIAWVVYLDSGGTPRYLLTSKPDREFYFLYRLEEGQAKRLGKAKSPVELEKKFRVRENIGNRKETG